MRHVVAATTPAWPPVADFFTTNAHDGLPGLAAAPASTAQPSRSPGIAQLAAGGPPRPLAVVLAADGGVVGAGSAGVATAFCILRNPREGVGLLERHRVARGATARNAGQLTTYF